MQQSRRRWVVGLAATAAAVAVIAKVAWFPDSWRIAAAAGAGECQVRRGWTQGDVARACGPPDALGIQPKIASGEGALFCSAPCDLRRGHVVLYDCQGRVYDAGPASSSPVCLGPYGGAVSP
jgi:hypothetical protein